MEKVNIGQVFEDHFLFEECSHGTVLFKIINKCEDYKDIFDSIPEGADKEDHLLFIEHLKKSSEEAINADIEDVKGWILIQVINPEMLHKGIPSITPLPIDGFDSLTESGYFKLVD